MGALSGFRVCRHLRVSVLQEHSNPSLRADGRVIGRMPDPQQQLGVLASAKGKGHCHSLLPGMRHSSQGVGAVTCSLQLKLIGLLAWHATGGDIPMLVGNLVAILFSALVTTVISLIRPDNYDWESSRHIAMVDDQDTGAR